VQPTDYQSGRFSCSQSTEAAKEESPWLPSPRRPGRQVKAMRDRVVRVLVALSSVAMIALAGGASLRGF
jgi:hypothetical protein